MRNYYITVIQNYPDDGNHLECHLPLPFIIRRGEDGYFYRDKKGKECKYNMFKGNKTDDRWIVHLYSRGISPSLEKIFEIHVSKDLDKIVDYCFKVYRKSLNMEFDRLVEIEKKLESEVTI